MSRRRSLPVGLLLVLALSQVARSSDSPPLTDEQKALHVLSRLGFGPRPGDVERVREMSVDAYIRLQLKPENIDDSATDKLLTRFDTLGMSSSHLSDEYMGDIRRFIQQQAAAGNAQDMKRRYGIEPAKPAGMAAPGAMGAQAAMGAPAANPNSMQELAKRDALRCVYQLQQAKLMRAALSERQLQEVLVDFWTNHFNIDIRKDACRALKIADDRDVIRPHVLGRFRDLLGASAHSPAMLTYLDNSENSVPRQVSAVERTIGKMYIQYKLGIKADGFMPERQGLNENYGREILELHTLGVDGGYTQHDVQEVARCFTGWGVSPFTGSFSFDSNHHDTGEKTVLGHVIPAGGGIEDGQKVLDILAAHPSTAKHISYKLCQRFVSDDPPPQLVDRAAKMFLLSDGDLRVVLRTILTSPEFFSPRAYRSKIKSPFEYAVSAVRATGATFIEPEGMWARAHETAEAAALLGYDAGKSGDRHKGLSRWVYDMGEPLFSFAAPTGYPELSTRWVNPGALIDRLNFAMALTEQNVSDVRIDTAGLLRGADTDQPQAVLDRVTGSLLYDQIGPNTRKTLAKQVLPEAGSGNTVDVAKLTALILGSPEFQRR